MFKIPRKKIQTRETEEATKAVLSELTDAVKAGDTVSAKAQAEIYATLATNEPSNSQKETMSDGVKIALISAGTSLLSILAVIRHENLNAIATKAFGMVIKPKI